MQAELISDDPRIQAAYERMLAEGTSPKLAEMFALQQPPGGMTDNVFLEGHCNGNQFEKTPKQGDQYAAMAKKHGLNVKGKVYLSGLAAFPGDPRAWVSSRGDVKKLCEERDWSCEGAVKTRSTNRKEPAPSIDLADDIVNAEVASIVAEQPEAATKIEDLREKVKKRRKPHWKE